MAGMEDLRGTAREAAKAPLKRRSTAAQSVKVQRCVGRRRGRLGGGHFVRRTRVHPALHTCRFQWNLLFPAISCSSELALCSSANDPIGVTVVTCVALLGCGHGFDSEPLREQGSGKKRDEAKREAQHCPSRPRFGQSSAAPRISAKASSAAATACA